MTSTPASTSHYSDIIAWEIDNWILLGREGNPSSETQLHILAPSHSLPESTLQEKDHIPPTISNTGTPEVVTVEDIPDERHQEEIKSLLNNMPKQQKSEATIHFEEQLQLAKAGDIQAMARVAELYEYGEGVFADIQESLSWYQKVVDATERSKEDTDSIGFCSFATSNVRPAMDPKGPLLTAMEAGQGDYQATICLAHKFQYWENGLPRDQNLALVLYRQGLGVDVGCPHKRATEGALDIARRDPQMIQNNQEALENLVKKVEDGDSLAKYLVDEKCPHAFFQPQPNLHMIQNNPATLENLVKEANNGDSDAMYRVGEAYSHGLLGLSKDNEMAMEWYNRSAESMNPMGLYLYSNIALRSNPSVLWKHHSALLFFIELFNIRLPNSMKTFEEAETLFREAQRLERKCLILLAMAAGKGCDLALFQIANALEHGKLGLEKDVPLAIQLYRQGLACRHQECHADDRLQVESCLTKLEAENNGASDMETD